MARDVVTATPATGLVEAAARMHASRVGALAVTDGDRLVGIVTERDVLRAVATGSVDGSVGDAMTPAPDTIGPEEPAGHAAALMIHGGFRHLPVMDGGTVAGIVSIRDLMRVTLEDSSPRGV
jgi:CBS domain-containing protein